MKAYVLINVTTGQSPQVVRDLRKIREITAADFTFGPYDVVAVVEAGDLGAVGRVVTEEIQTTPGVLKTLTCLQIPIG
ncbi:MAG: Lrp/AsnC ligand binding domain-containing protein [Chloroflexi bacterium]|nr:Lrp/AsnC ligand binding domain-containing protein [Chloroflexota bacterium]MBI3761976.1 Lrp/AsnC ligand binding domain-containing protein [Chloroflexota bacterium]